MALTNRLQESEFCQNTLVQHWLSSYQTGDLYSLLKDHWREYVLLTFRYSDDQAKEERLATKFLFRPMEYFLCSGEPDDVFKQLKDKDQPAQLCGHVFKNGEPTYSCRECATDPTCVLCIECFQNSIHKKHRYRMSTSGGGGYCDCGDPEAWKTEPFCTTHRPEAQEMDESKNPMEMLPDELTDRASALFVAALRYTVDMLTWEQCDSLPVGLQPEGELTDHYICMLFNDEVHTYEQVIMTLQRAVDCTHKEAVDFATTVDREGRSSVTEGSFENCEKARNVIERNTSRHGAKPLKVQVMHKTVVAHQQFALKMITWLQGIIGQSDGLRRLFCVLSMQQQEDEKSLMEVLLLADTQLWKIARVQSHQLMMAGVLMDQECKKKFAIIFTKHYPQLMKAFCLDDHDHDVSIASLSVQIFTVISLYYRLLMRDFVQDDHMRGVSVTKISVQIFTVLSLARQLVAEHNLLSVILNTFLEACEEKKNKYNLLSVIHNTFLEACEEKKNSVIAMILYHTEHNLLSVIHNTFLQACEEKKNKYNLLSVIHNTFLEACEEKKNSVIAMILYHTEHNLLSVIHNTFLQACEEKKNKEGKLSFERTGSQIFKNRACYMLHDLKYALICKPSPSEWTDSLRENFLRGFQKFLQLLQIIDGMDPVKRQTGQHLEFEPEWEMAFNLQLKMEDNIALFLAWCGSDREVLIKAFNQTVSAFHDCKSVEKTKKDTCVVAGHTLKCVRYDVSSQSVSIHLPITRILSGLFVYFGDYGLRFESPDCCLVKPDPTEIIELPLRAQVMVAQTQAGMWRRNGYALLNQIYFYHNVKCRTEMYDKDVMTLQIGASLLNGDQFLIHILNKYGLMTWVKHEFDDPKSGQEDSVRQTVMLAEEFLNLLITVLSERYVPGIGEITRADVVRREVIHQLCIAPMAHSELAKALPEDRLYNRQPSYHREFIKFSRQPNHETGLESVVADVAVFKKQAGSSGPGKGKYDLKPECYALYNPYFYHYSKVEKSKSEEAQVKRRKESNEILALPPPVPPRFTPQFQSVINLLQCDVMIHIMELILARTVATRSRSWSEAQMERILHLIGLALHEQKSAIETGNHEYEFLSRACGQAKESSKSKKEHKSILSLLESAVNCQNISHDSSRDLVSWTLKLLNEVRQLKNEPVSMDTLDQIAMPKDNKVEIEKRKKEVAAKRRAKIMAKMSAMQKNFIKENAELFENTSTELFPRVGSDMDLCDMESSTFPIAVGPRKTPVTSLFAPRATCILCQEEQDVTLTEKAMVLTAFVQKSTVLSLSHGNALLDGENHDPLLMSSDLSTGAHVSSCGHTMHADCWQRFFDAIVARERRRPLRFRHNYSYDIDKLEFLCPLCECISNTVIPMLPPLTSPAPDSTGLSQLVQLHFSDWLDGIHRTVLGSIKEAEAVDQDAAEDSILYQPCPLSAVTKMMAETVANNFQMLWAYVQDDNSDSFNQELRNMLQKFANDVYSFGLGVDPDDENPRVPVMAWNACAFTIMSTEQMLRDEGKPLFGSLAARQNDCLKALIKFTVLSTQSHLTKPEHIKEHCIKQLAFLFPDAPKGKKLEKLSLLDVDMFHFLTSLVMSLPSLHQDPAVGPPKMTLPSGGVNDQHALHLVMAAHLIQILLTFDQEDCGMEVEGDYEGEALLIIYDKLQKLAQVPSENHPLPWQLSVHIRKTMLPFLRCSALLYHYLTGVSAPSELTEVHDSHEEFDFLCKYLGMNNHMSRLLDNQGELMDTIITKWCKSPVLQEKFTASSQPLVQYPLRINKLIQLPEDYSELINKASTFTCPKSDGDDSRAPTMCLVCGKMLCSQSYCCQTEFEGATMGAATEHAYKCGGGAGIFLRVRDCQIILLAGKTKGCFVHPPYIDDYGETDQGLRRGNPLHLCTDSYRHLEKLWMSHSIPETIAHQLESNTTLQTIDWQHL